MVAEFKEMPGILKFATVHAFGCVLFAVFYIIPGVPISVNGREMYSEELWVDGTGIFLLLIGTIMPVCGWLMLKRHRLSRAIYLTVLTSVMVGPYVYNWDVSLFSAGIVFVVFAAWYLYGYRKSKVYFASNKKN